MHKLLSDHAKHITSQLETKMADDPDFKRNMMILLFEVSEQRVLKDNARIPQHFTPVEASFLETLGLYTDEDDDENEDDLPYNLTALGRYILESYAKEDEDD